MREILLRGKRIDNDEWAEGYLLYDDISTIAAIVTYVNLGGGGNVGDLSEINILEVDPETIGQYTGLTDKNGKKIFEGDICQNGERTYFICWISWQCTWGCCNLKTGRKTPTYQVISREGNNFEVIGNIHDNPELIGGDDNG